MLQILAGPSARAAIAREGLVPRLFDKVIAASGGPKWLPLAELDRHLLFRFFPAEHPLSLLGTSSGAWRCATLSSQQGDDAHRRLQHAYIEQRYEKPPSPAEIDEVCRGILAHAIGDEAEVLCNTPHRRLNLIACRGRGPNGRGTRPLLGLGLALTAVANAAHRLALASHWQRWLFHSGEQSAFLPLGDLPTRSARLTPDNLLPVLLASGSIPMVLPGVTAIPGAAPGRYFDGGITDYHLDLPSLNQGELTLYPHFYPHAVPGWFDKPFPWRRARSNFDKVVILAPTEAFIARLPGGKLPDRSDFSELNTEVRLRHWHRAAASGEALVEAFEALRQDPMSHLKPL